MKRAPILALGIFLLIPVMAQAVTWTGNGDGKNWNDPKNWDTGMVPGPSDDVMITKNTDTVSVTDAAFANTVECVGIFTVASGLTISSTSSFTSLAITAGAALKPGGDMTILGPLTISGGAIQGQGSVDIKGDTTVSGSGGLESGQGRVTNDGNMTITGNGTQLTVGSLFVNNGKISIQSDGNAGITSPGGFIFNSGSIAKTAGTGISIVGATVSFNNNSGGTISANMGTLQVFGGTGSEAGTFEAASGATLEFPPGDFSNLTLSSGATITGGGIVHMTGGIWTLAVDVTVSVAQLVLEGGNSKIIDGTNNLNITSTSVLWYSGDIRRSDTSGKVTISAGTTVQILNNKSGSVNLFRTSTCKGRST